MSKFCNDLWVCAPHNLTINHKIFTKTHKPSSSRDYRIRKFIILKPYLSEGTRIGPKVSFSSRNSDEIDLHGATWRNPATKLVVDLGDSRRAATYIAITLLKHHHQSDQHKINYLERKSQNHVEIEIQAYRLRDVREFVDWVRRRWRRCVDDDSIAGRIQRSLFWSDGN